LIKIALPSTADEGKYKATAKTCKWHSYYHKATRVGHLSSNWIYISSIRDICIFIFLSINSAIHHNMQLNSIDRIQESELNQCYPPFQMTTFIKYNDHGNTMYTIIHHVTHIIKNCSCCQYRSCLVYFALDALRFGIKRIVVIWK
jgi:hypothetical protein